MFQYIKMKIGSIIASIGIILGTLGLLCLLPLLWNPNELSYVADPAFPKGSGWFALGSQGVFFKPGVAMLLLGVFLYCFAKYLPRKYWKTHNDPKTLGNKRQKAKFHIQ